MKLPVKIVHDERGWYTAACPELPGCSTRGATRREAVQKLDDAIQGYLGALGHYTPAHLEPEVVEAPPKETDVEAVERV